MIPREVDEWLGAPVRERAVRPLAGGAVSDRVERWTVTLVDGRVVDLVYKTATGAEIAGLRAAQVVRPAATAVPDLVAAGADWLVTPFVDGTRGAHVPANLLESLALLHTRFAGVAVAGVPLVDPEWWRGLCLGWVAPQVPDGRARRVVTRAAAHPAVADVLGRLTPTLLHGDVHDGNVIVCDGAATLIDWGSARVGPAMLDLANLAEIGDLDPYRRAAGDWLTEDQIDLGYRWAALQIPVQYLPWTAGNRPADQVTDTLDRIEIALASL